MTDKIKNRIEELKALKQKAEETHSKALQTLQQCEVDIIALDSAIKELESLVE